MLHTEGLARAHLLFGYLPETQAILPSLLDKLLNNVGSKDLHPSLLIPWLRGGIGNHVADTQHDAQVLEGLTGSFHRRLWVPVVQCALVLWMSFCVLSTLPSGC